MEAEKQPEPVPLGVAKELLEKELSVRENRLRCVDCGNFQAVPDVEPETEKSDDDDEESSFERKKRHYDRVRNKLAEERNKHKKDSSREESPNLDHKYSSSEEDKEEKVVNI